ncbi:MAG: helix-turn-helix transcriptional regulator [Anaerorhabdus sp.]|uniref:helix-turn-helix domain-containing protein n=1 Tax=Anaerorhabdus sp. TaxID=1872524 RepID=UPI002FC6AD09
MFYLSLGESLKNARISNNMTQEFVASSIGVSRQAVSKWENGTSDPSTANLLALSKLYQISPEQLLRDISK